MILTLYAAGVLIGVIFGDARPLSRLGLALLWPLAFLAFAVTVVVLIAVAVIALPFQHRGPASA